MGANLLIDDPYDFKFKDLELHGCLVGWSDSLPQRLARHVYVKRDGAELEPTGADPGTFKFRLAFMGEHWATNYRALVQSIRDNPRGLLIHPILGEIQVGCMGIDSADSEPGQALNLLNVSITFVEDQVDGTFALAEFEGPAAKQAKVDTWTGTLGALASKFLFAASEFEKLIYSANVYAEAAYNAIANNEPNPALATMLGDVGTKAQALGRLLKQEQESRSGASRDYQPAVEAVERTHSACVELDEAIQYNHPTLEDFVVPATMPLATLAALRYGKNAKTGMDEMLTLNRIADPHAIPAGTVLRVRQAA